MSKRNYKSKFISNIKFPYHKSWDNQYNYMTVDIKDIRLSLVNGIRRSIINSVKTVSFGNINIILNNSPLHNQFLSHRIEMIPINVDNIDTFEVDDYEFIIKRENSTNDIVNVTTQDIKVKRLSDGKQLTEREVRKLFPPNPITKDFILITCLKPYNISGETNKLHIVANATVNCGKENARFNPASCSTYSFIRDPKRVKEGLIAYLEQEKKSHMQRDLQPPTDEQMIRHFELSLADRFFYIDELGEANQFHFKIESVGVMRPIHILYLGIVEVRELIKSFLSNVVNDNHEFVEIKPSQDNVKGFEFIINNADDTLGSILQEYLYLLYVSPVAKEVKLNYVGYNTVHPLKKIIILKICPKGYHSDLDRLIDDILKPCCNKIIAICDVLLDDIKNTTEYKMYIGKVGTRKTIKMTRK